jgi:hypothetical protein
LGKNGLVGNNQDGLRIYTVACVPLLQSTAQQANDAMSAGRALYGRTCAARGRQR